MIRLYPDEKFREIPIDYPLKFRYAVSSRGRLVSYTDSVENGNLLKGSRTDGYTTFAYQMRINGKIFNKKIFIYKYIAEYFVPKESEDHKHALHLDYVRDNDTIQNLKWATYEEMIEHRRKSPHIIRAKQKLLEHNIKSDGRKLTVTKVMHLKTLLKDPNRKTRLKMLAKQFGVSEMQVRRIQSGENWDHIKV